MTVICSHKNDHIMEDIMSDDLFVLKWGIIGSKVLHQVGGNENKYDILSGKACMYILIII